MTEHTPGPWHYSNPIDGRDIPYRIDDSEGHHLADVHDNHYGYALPAKDNACLFASAPETAAERDRLKVINAKLLLFAKQSERVFSDLANGTNRSCWVEMRNKATAAIAKAEGSE